MGFVAYKKLPCLQFYQCRFLMSIRHSIIDSLSFSYNIYCMKPFTDIIIVKITIFVSYKNNGQQCQFRTPKHTFYIFLSTENILPQKQYIAFLETENTDQFL